MSLTDEILSTAATVGPAPEDERYDPLWDEVYEDYGWGPVARHYDREGRPISMRDWCRLRRWDEENGHAYKRIANDEIGPYWISTVWLGLDHGLPGYEKPRIFETMVFGEPKFRPPEGKHPGYWYRPDFDMRRYSTEEDALAGHQEIVEEVRIFLAANPEWKPEEVR